jgi:type IV pilus assembly protein PilE
MQIRMKGVTLIELVVVVAIVALLASIAVPTYRNYLLRSHRVEAKAALLNLAAAQEKFYLQNNSYAANSVLSTAPPTGLGIPGTTKNGYYTIAISNASTTTFAATATATGAQTEDTDCATFAIDALGVKSATKSGGSASTACWN